MSSTRDTTPVPAPVAIVGMACLLPGARSPEEFWAGLRAGADHRGEGDRAVFGTDPDTPGGWGDDRHRITATRGGFVTEPEIDLTGLRRPADELAALGRVVRWPVHVVRQALASAGIAETDPVLARTGLVLGNYSFPTERSVDLAVPLVRRAVTEGLRAAGLPLPDPVPGDPVPGEPEAPPAALWPSGLPATVVSDAFGLGGPRLALDAACSSALYAMALARDYLATGQADVVLAGAVCAPDPLLIHLSFSDLRAYPGNGVSQPFHPDSSGIVTGQGAGVLVLKRLADALRDGDRVHAVVDSIGLSNDGAGSHLLSPNVRGQLAAYRQAYQHVDPSTVDYVECHATGTPLGDPVELRGLAEFFGDDVPLLGSVKGNVGHLLTVAGFTSVLKAVLAMRHGVIPATPGVTEPIRPAGAEAAASRIVLREQPWPERADGGPRRAGVSAFGFGGTNAHLVLTAPQPAPEAAPRPGPEAAPGPAPEAQASSVGRLAVAGVGVRLGPVRGTAELDRVLRTGESALVDRPPQRWYGADPLVDLPDTPAGYADQVDVDVRAYRLPPAELRDANPQHLLLFQAADEALAEAGYPAPDPAARAEDLPARRVAVVVAMEMEPRTHSHRARFDIGAHVRAECARAGVTLTPDQLDRLEAAVRDGVHDPIGATEVLSYIGNIMASRIASSRNLTGPAFTLSLDATAGARALEVAGLLLLDPTVDAVLVGGVELAGGVENTLARARLAGGAPPVLGDGAVALVLTRPTPAAQKPGQVAGQVTVDGIALRHGPDAPAAAARAGLAAAGVTAADVEHLELASAVDPAGLAALAALHPTGGDPFGCALTSTVTLVGDTQHASVLVGVASAVLTLRHAHQPTSPAPLHQIARQAPGFAESNLRLLAEPRPWLRGHRDARRVSAVHTSTPDGTAAAHVVLSAGPVTVGAAGGAASVGSGPAGGWRGLTPVLLVLRGPDGVALAEQATACLAELDAGRDVAALARQALSRADVSRADLAREAGTREAGARDTGARDTGSGHGDGARTAVLVAADAAGMRRELAAAARDLPAALAAGADWQTPAGSFATGRPLGPDGKVAFVYPGAFTSYPGAGRDLFRLFPALLDGFERRSERPRARFKQHALFPSAPLGVDRRALLRHEADLVDDIPVVLATGTNLAVLHTELLRDVLGVRPHGGFGYSLGESSMLFALGVWAEQARDDGALAATPLFRDQLRGPRRLVRDTWALPDDTPDAEVWSTHVLLAPADQVRAAMTGLDRVFLTHVNTPNEVVVAGAPDQCRELIGRLGCQHAKAPASHVMHCPVVDPVLPGLAVLNDYPLGAPDPALDLLSAYDYAPVDTADRARIADRIAWTLRSTIDFARLATTAHDRGFRYFVEVGPGATCTRWIGETLSDRPHLAVSVDRRGAGTGTALAQAVARLVGHGLPVALEHLVPAPEPVRVARFAVPVGGESVPDRVARAAAPVLRAAHTAQPELRAAHAAPSELSAIRAGRSEPRAARFEPRAEQVFAMAEWARDDVITVTGTPFVYLPTPLPRRDQQPRPDHPRPAQLRALAPAARQSQPQRPAQPQQPVRALAAAVAGAHRSALRAHDAVLQQALRALEAGMPVGTVDPGQQVPPPRPPSKPTGDGRPVIWDEDDLLEFARGSVARVFGPEFAVVDEYPVRVRLPEPPYLFVSRVTELTATTGRFEPSTITTEYDVPRGAWYSVDGLVPCAVTIEAGQCDLLLVAYLGIDFRNQGRRAYRLLDSKLVFHGGLPREGQTLRYEIRIDRFVWNGDTLLFFFNYRCFADGELILELLDACAGFFSTAELDDSLGVVLTEADRRRRAAMTRAWFTPLARTDRTALSTTDLQALTEGRPGDVFGPEWDQTADGCNRSLRLPDPALRMIDEVTAIDRLGGPRGLGELTAVKHLDPDGWYFRCHFTGDPVLAGSLVAEGGVQLLQVYAMYLGLHLVLPDAEFQSVPGLHTEVKVRGQITPRTPNLRYHVEVTDITMLPRPTVIADILVYDGDKPIISMRNFGIQVREKPGAPYRPGPGGVPPFLGRRNHRGEPAFINELHLAHAAKGDLATAMGPEFEIYADRRAPYIPNGDFRFVDRIMTLTGTRGVLKPGARMETEYDCPPEAWYFHENSFANTPNCVLMESSLQAAILLGYYLGATLASPDEELAIRNLDGRATWVKDVDLRGKTIRHRSELLSSQAVPGATLQNFRYELLADDEPFYVGESLFGYFTADALANQVGLDGGKHLPPWLDEHPEVTRRTLPVRDDDRWFSGPLRLGDGHLRLVDEVDVVDGGGRHGLGYLRGRRRIDPDDWYFACHFHRDPVMPGSLGVEAVLQALQVFALDAGLADGFARPEFALPRDVPMGWKYRGQILRTDREMTFDLHVKEIRRAEGELLVIADASIWKPQLRIYELTDVAVAVRDHAHQEEAR